MKTTLAPRRGSLTALIAPRNQKIVGTLKLRAHTINPTFSSTTLASLKALSNTGRRTRIPLELIEHILELYFECHTPGSLRLLYSHVKNIRVCCKLFNRITLKHVFRFLDVPGPVVWKNLVGILEREEKKGSGGSVGFAWVRHIVARKVYDIVREPSPLSRFTRLSSLSLDFGLEGLHTQYDCVTKLLKAILGGDAIPSTNRNSQTVTAPLKDERLRAAMPSLTSLKMRKLPVIDATLLGYIARAFPNLVSLVLDSTSRLNTTCCPTCFEDSMTLTIHSPIPRRYNDAEHLAMTFGEALHPLTRLTSLHLGLFLLPEPLLEAHLNHSIATSPFSLDPTTLTTCTVCSDSEFLRRRYTSRRYLQYQELVASIRIAQFIKSLEVISWDSYGQGESNDGEGEGSVQASTKAEVTEAGEVIRFEGSTEGAVAGRSGNGAVVGGQGMAEPSVAAEGDASSPPGSSEAVTSSPSTSTSSSSTNRYPFKLEIKVTRDLKNNRVRVRRSPQPAA